MEKGSEKRRADHPIDKIFVDRWSPRAMSGEAIVEHDLMVLFEAARWAPSSYGLGCPFQALKLAKVSPAVHKGYFRKMFQHSAILIE